MFIPLVSAAENVSIKSVTLVDKSASAEELSDILGTLLYCSPEIIRNTGFEAYDPRSVYGLIDQINEAVDNYEENIRENGLVLKR